MAVYITLSDCEMIERWGMFEVTLEGPANGDPFVDVQIGAEFQLMKKIPQGIVKSGKFEYACKKDFASRLSIRD